MRSARDALPAAPLALCLFVANLALALPDVIGGGLSFPVPVDGLPPPPGAAAAAAAGRDRRDFGLSQDDFDYIMRSLGPGEEMAAAIQERVLIIKSISSTLYPLVKLIIGVQGRVHTI